MTLKKAKEILLDLLGDGPYFSPELRRKAVKLGGEALDRLLNLRAYDDVRFGKLLPGETKGD